MPRDLGRDAGQEMVLQVLADPGQRVRDRDADAAEMVGIADPGQLQDMRRADRAAGQDHLGQRVDALGLAAARELDPDRALAVEQHAMHQRVGDDLEVGPPHRRAQIGARRALPAPAAPGLLHPADAARRPRRQAVDVLAVFETGLDAGLDELLAQRRLVGGARGQQRPAAAVEVVGALLPALGALEIGSTSSHDQPRLPSWPQWSKSSGCPRT